MDWNTYHEDSHDYRKLVKKLTDDRELSKEDRGIIERALNFGWRPPSTEEVAKVWMDRIYQLVREDPRFVAEMYAFYIMQGNRGCKSVQDVINVLKDQYVRVATSYLLGRNK